jgi:hypothetical protein
MPSDPARNASAQQIAAKMRDVHAREASVEELLRQVTDQPTIEELSGELSELRQLWLTLAAEYSEAVGQFSQAADEARRGGGKGK